MDQQVEKPRFGDLFDPEQASETAAQTASGHAESRQSAERQSAELLVTSISFSQASDSDSATDPATDVGGSVGAEVEDLFVELTSPTDTSGAFFQPPSMGASSIQLTDVVASVHESYPLVFAAFQERAIADGNQVSAWGSFDTKLKASSETNPVGFYQTYRTKAGLERPIYSGGEFFAGYKIGKGDFEPWYLERETDEGGEFRAGVLVPLGRNRDIDSRRADLWRATYDRQIANPLIRTQLVLFAREASLAYWKWVAAGEKYKLGLRWVELAEDRNQRIINQYNAEELAIVDVRDNEAAIAKRKAKLAEAKNELRQAAVKLGLYFRDPGTGKPIIPTADRSPGFPALRASNADGFAVDVPSAQAARPELQALGLELRKLQVDFAEAENLTKAGLDALIAGSQDVGQNASSSEDKDQFVVEASLFFDVPLERRKGRGKMHAVQAKMAAVNAKRRLVQEKVTGEVMLVYVALEETRKQAQQSTESVDLYDFVAEKERVRFELGESDLLKVALREQYALEAAEEQITALYKHFVAFTEYAAVLAIDRPSVDILPAVANTAEAE
ncbi:MAG: TolC family protein [Fuerstiella sp.]